MTVRIDQQLIIEWINPESSVLDLGCGDGTLMQILMEGRNVTGYGLEIDSNNIVKCLNAGINVIHTDIDAGLSDFDDHTFDYVIMSQTLQATYFPDTLIDEMLRVGKQGIVTFPNFGHWKNRIMLAIMGMMPVSKALPHRWFNTPNIHLCTLKDFEIFCKEKNIKILERAVVNCKHKSSIGMKLFPNFLGAIALYRFQRR